MGATIYYFSGTGNSYKVAKAIGEGLSDAKLVSITNVKNEQLSDTIGIVFPLYYFGLPIIVEEFLQQLDIPKNAYVFIVVTRGVNLAGGAKRQIDLIFNSKSTSYNLFRYITMGNNFVFHSFDASSKIIKIKRNQNADIKASGIISKIRAKSTSKIFSILDYPPFASITFKLPTYGYKHFLKIYNKDVYFKVDESLCNKCGKCKKVCPTINIKIGAKVEWNGDNCQLCLACYNCCPKNAIQYIDKVNKVDTSEKGQYWNF